MIFPLLEAAKVMLYRLDWQGLPVYMRNTVKSTLAVVDISITCQQTSLHKTKQPSQVGTLSMPAVANSYTLCSVFLTNALPAYLPWIYGSFFRNVVFINAESWPPTAVSPLATSTIAMLALFFKNPT